MAGAEAKIFIDFPWERGRQYECVKRRRKRSEFAAAAYEVDDRVIRQMDEANDSIRPLEVRGRLYLDFAELDGSPEKCIQFAQSWGLLGIPHAHAGAEERLSDWRSAIAHMKDAINGLRRAFDQKHPIVSAFGAAIVPVKAKLIADKHGLPRWAFQPETLVDAMRLQAAQAIVSGRAVHVCEQCGSWFESGANAKRSIARFCSDKCRAKFHYRHHRRKA
jgi:hypothetical protein